MSACESQKTEASKDNVSTHSVDEGLPRELSQLSLSSASNPDEFHCNKGHSEITMKNIFGYYQSQKLCDVSLIAGGCRQVLYLKIFPTNNVNNLFSRLLYYA